MKFPIMDWLGKTEIEIENGKEIEIEEILELIRVRLLDIVEREKKFRLELVSTKPQLKNDLVSFLKT